MTPCTVGACWARGPLVELGDEVAQRAPGRAAAKSSARSTRAARDSHRSRTAPAAGRAAARSSPRRPGRRARRRQPRRPRPRSPPRGPRRAAAGRLAHLGALEEPLAAAQQVGHAGVGECLLQRLGLGVHAVKDGDLAGRRCPPRAARGCGRGDACGLGGVVVVLGKPGSGPAGRWATSSSRAGAGGPSRPSRAGVGQGDDLWRGAVVADEPHHGRAGVPARELEQVVGGGAGEGVDGLAGVADDAERRPGRPARGRAGAAAAG